MKTFFLAAIAAAGATLAAAETAETTVPAETLLQVPVSPLIPGNAADARPKIDPPGLDDPDAAQRGEVFFNQFNCSGCHAPGGGGGMGPALSNRFFLYGGAPENIYLTIAQGRPHGMPAFSSLLPPQAIWELVAYVRKLSQSQPEGGWGKTIPAPGGAGTGQGVRMGVR
ncbi:c-type cytochrome [Methylocystis echinoides]|uniref:c-type cytochrome n=1 Tax=Methylocystis echinoides TaxID=29468 RepID=UPI00343B8921